MNGPAAWRGANILVVDDEPDVCQMCKILLEASGHRVTMVESGERALHVCAEEDFDLVLLDVRMPGIDGFETAKRLGDSRRTANVPVIFLTAQSDVASRQRAIEVGAADFIGKPVDRNELEIRVRSLLWVRRLQRDVGDLYELLRLQRDGLLEARRQRADLTAFVVHDLRSPLTAVLLGASGLAESQELPPPLRVDADAIRAGAESMQLMLGNLQALSTAEDTGLRVNRYASDVGAVAREAVAGVALRARATAHVFDLGDVHSAVAYVDPPLIRRVLENLLINALKYSSAGTSIRVSVRRDGDDVRLVVSDTGPGIPVAMRERIFDRYFRLEKDAASGSREGNGLGLAFCKAAVLAHGGGIAVDDEPSGGTRFLITLPVGGDPTRVAKSAS